MITRFWKGLDAFNITISLVASDIIQNFVSRILVLSDRAFVDGDEIKIQVGGKEYEGEVAKISIRTTIIATKDGNTVTIPNSAFVSNPVIRKKHMKPEER